MILIVITVLRGRQSGEGDQQKNCKDYGHSRCAALRTAG